MRPAIGGMYRLGGSHTQQDVRKEHRLAGYPEPLIVSNVRDEQGRAIGVEDAGRFLHSDVSYKRLPSLLSALYALEVPVKDGTVLGGTSFASNIAAYEALPEELKARLQGLKNVHSYRFYRAKSFQAQREEQARGARTVQEHPLSEERLNSVPDVEVPVVRTHPVTKRKGLFINEAPFEISLNSVSMHIRILERAGLVSRRVAGRDHFLSLERKPFDELTQWRLKTRDFWTSRLDALEAALRVEDAICVSRSFDCNSRRGIRLHGRLSAARHFHANRRTPWLNIAASLPQSQCCSRPRSSVRCRSKASCASSDESSRGPRATCSRNASAAATAVPTRS
ncbi:MAG: hypothetical protein EXR29_02705 [Betaproteobacteria bacterium]|nr:hypothetical protein [Betaproteobacteria bacterium]